MFRVTLLEQRSIGGLYESLTSVTSDHSFYTARNQARRATRQALKAFEKEVARCAKTNPKKFYKYISSRTKVRVGISELHTADRRAISDEEKATALNDFFVSVFTNEDTNPPTYEMHRVDTPWPDLKLTHEQVHDELRSLNESKSPGPDRLHPKVLRETADTITAPLLTIHQHSLDIGEVPEAWKRARVTAIYKGSRNDPGNYRPVSITSICCKVLEKLIRQAFVKHMSQNNLFTKEQHGFLGGRSCITQLLSALEEWTDALDKGVDIDTIYFDFAKAFDTVPHRRLVAKLKSYQISRQLVRWTESYLHNRVQQVSVNSVCSEWIKVTSGVPQGSVLGPVLFLAFINDMPGTVENSIRLFADDTKLYRAVTSADNDRKSLQRDIDTLDAWSQKWMLKFHPDKCKIMRIGQRHREHTYSMKTSDGQTTEIKKTTAEKDLGVTIDNRLTFSEHINNTVKKANQVMGMIRRTFKFIDKDIFALLFKSRVRPILEYGNTIWSPRLKKDIDAIERVQRRATKTVPGLATLPYPERLRVLKLPSLIYRRARGDMIETYKYQHNVYDIDNEWLKPETSTVTRGHTRKLIKPRCNSTLRLHCFSHRVVNPWNSLPENVVSAPSVNAFKSRLDNHWKAYQFTVEQIVM